MSPRLQPVWTPTSVTSRLAQVSVPAVGMNIYRWSCAMGGFWFLFDLSRELDQDTRQKKGFWLVRQQDYTGKKKPQSVSLKLRGTPRSGLNVCWFLISTHFHKLIHPIVSTEKLIRAALTIYVQDIKREMWVILERLISLFKYKLFKQIGAGQGSVWSRRPCSNWLSKLNRALCGLVQQ